MSYRPYSELELRQKMAKKKYGEEEIEKTITRLKELKYLDDTDFTRRFVQNRLNFNPRGKYLLIQELKQKGVEPVITEKILAEIKFDEYRIAQTLKKKKEKSLKNLPPLKKRQKIMFFLQSKGFSPDVIYKVIGDSF